MPRILFILPEDVDIIGVWDFKQAYKKHVEGHGLNRDGTPPEFVFTVRPTYLIHVEGFSL